MYYYIFDIKKCRKKSQVDEIKSHLSVLGITGEFTYPTAAQTVEELVDLGLSKKYSTIVAIGGDELSNSVAKKLVGNPEAMGIIPLEASQELSDLIGVKSWREASEVLRYRKITEIRLGRTATGNCFLTEAHLDAKAPVEVTLEFKDFIIQATVSGLKITNFSSNVKKSAPDFLDITFTSINTEQGRGIKEKLSSLFGGKTKKDENSFSYLKARSLRIFTKYQIPILSSGGELIAKTPQLIESSDETLRLITAKKAATFWEET